MFNLCCPKPAQRGAQARTPLPPGLGVAETLLDMGLAWAGEDARSKQLTPWDQFDIKLRCVLANLLRK